MGTHPSSRQAREGPELGLVGKGIGLGDPSQPTGFLLPSTAELRVGCKVHRLILDQLGPAFSPASSAFSLIHDSDSGLLPNSVPAPHFPRVWESGDHPHPPLRQAVQPGKFYLVAAVITPLLT